MSYQGLTFLLIDVRSRRRRFTVNGFRQQQRRLRHRRAFLTGHLFRWNHVTAWELAWIHEL